ncbi:MAG: uracil-DNA glycosylase family protein [Bacteroidota bacterium]
MQEITTLIHQIRQCNHCAEQLPLGPRPIISFSERSKIILISQAPGSVVHASGVAWADQSGERLRAWLGVSDDAFYNTDNFAIVPMGFCYPGRGKSGDLPPLPACAPLWHEQVLAHLSSARLTLIIGQYAQRYYLGQHRKKTLTATVQHYQDYLPRFFPLPHPSPRNNIWMAKNEWFTAEVVPALQLKVAEILG